ncbi:transcriptional regulator with XRE-family HTH domain [Rhodoblastus acidophilus]|uniref:helix-turn-helix domain-containing protein n=1 Tax=Rhodoblastus acidophilus TaxID=1074 RepID=UPI0022247F0D|nr:helix-turn-helix transcriptional regulator [Rhodoblastus acidophilus]MCW2283262.1 transcriptional regulator with XRE-family HTH domain [Rhodoblastus acidophilus]MCW2332122.1 transcriptional regulator with XRE-family HTH domain [Rhodoblastus acidophilus]
MQVLNPIDVQLGRSLRNRRFAAGLSIHNFATAIGVTNARLLEFESGEERIEARIMANICDVLDARPSAFFAWVSNESPSGQPRRQKLDAA